MLEDFGGLKTCQTHKTLLSRGSAELKKNQRSRVDSGARQHMAAGMLDARLGCIEGSRAARSARARGGI